MGTTSESSMNLYQKLAQIRKQAEVIKKNKSGYGYKYVSEDEILAKISGGMHKYGVSLIPSVVPNTMCVEPYEYTQTKAKKTGEIYESKTNEIIVKAEMLFTWVNNENPEEHIEVPWCLIGQQSDGSQSFGSGLTYAVRYFLLKFFNIATPDDDPDNWRSKQKAASEAEDKMIAEQIIKRFDEIVRPYLEQNPDKKDAVKEYASKYAKGGNYKAIQDSVTASKLLSGFKEEFNIDEEE